MGRTMIRNSTATAGAGKKKRWRRSTKREIALKAVFMAMGPSRENRLRPHRVKLKRAEPTAANYRSIFLSINSAAFLADAATSLPSIASTITWPVMSRISGTLMTGGFHWPWPMSKDFIVAAVQSGCLSPALYSLESHDDFRPDGTPARSAPRQFSLLVAHWMNSHAAF